MVNDCFYVYMLRCTDGSIYTGIAADLKRRMSAHFGKTTRCARYTKSHTAFRLEQAWQTESRQIASRLEYRIKKLSKVQKEQLIKDPALLEALCSAVDCPVHLVDAALYCHYSGDTESIEKKQSI